MTQRPLASRTVWHGSEPMCLRKIIAPNGLLDQGPIVFDLAGFHTGRISLTRPGDAHLDLSAARCAQ
ncbi:hypothetical protein C9I56_26970 [Paraburkholderia caribensis]|nr:hypothetical protein ATN79_03780 [Paraburkholderia caribensis]PTB25670.1 hypothetical protein C9I56_26970 [Paraburkholderia caribensis]